MIDLIHDIRYAVRTLRRARALAVTVVVILALGIGGTTAAFAVVDNVLLRALPIAAPEQLVQLTATGLPPFGGSMGQGGALSYAAYLALRDATNGPRLAAAARVPVHVGFGRQAERMSAELVSGSYFTTVGAGAAAGRTITADDDRDGAPAVAMITYRLWQARLNGDPDAVGRSILVNGSPVTLIGVVQPGFDGFDLDEPAQVFVPIRMQPSPVPTTIDRESRLFRWVRVYARVPDTGSIAATRALLGGAYHSFVA